MKILAIDPGCKTGWAIYANGIVESGVEDFSLKHGESVGMRWVRYRAWLHRMFINQLLVRLTFVLYEQPYRVKGYAPELLHGMTTRIQEECERRSIHYAPVPPTHLKKFATGKGNANKERMLAEARKRFGEYIDDDNEADALLMLELAKSGYRG
jgi:hypothetical protein